MNKKQYVITILFYGAMWGLLEATVGHLLHFIPATIAGSIMFPIASLVLYKTYQKTSSTRALFYVALIAAAIKSVDFLLPALSIYKTINPMISIVLEGLMVVAVIGMITSQQQTMQIGGWMTASISWRVLFVLWMGLQYVLTGNLAPFIADTTLLLQFVLVSGVISGLFTVVMIEIERRISWETTWNQRLSVASFLFVLACIVTYTL